RRSHARIAPAQRRVTLLHETLFDFVREEVLVVAADRDPPVLEASRINALISFRHECRIHKYMIGLYLESIPQLLKFRKPVAFPETELARFLRGPRPHRPPKHVFLLAIGRQKPGPLLWPG